MVTPGMPHPTPLQGQPHLMRQPDQLHHHQGAVSQQAQLSPAAAQQLTSEALIHQQMFAGAPVYATHSPTMMHNRTQVGDYVYILGDEILSRSDPIENVTSDSVLN